MATLVILRDGEIDAEIPLLGNVRVGRDAQNDVVLEDASRGVSRFHAEIRATATGYSIVDLNSRNGVWLNGRKVQEAALTFGVPVTLGGYELVLEDRPVTDGFATSEASQLATIVNRDAADADRGRPSGSSTRMADVRAQNKRAYAWLTAAAVLLIASGVAFYFVRTRPPAAPPPNVVVAPPVDAPATPPAPTTTPAPTTSTSDPTAPTTGEKQSPVSVVSSELPPPPPTVAPPPKPPSLPPPQETAGIPRLPNETAVEWQARARRVRANYDSAKASLGRRDYRQTVSFLTLLHADMPRYLDSDDMMAEAVRERQAAAKEALAKGQEAERGKDSYGALQWYEQSAQDESTPELLEHIKTMRDRVKQEAEAAYRDGNQLRAFGRKLEAIARFENVVKWLPEDDPTRKAAAKLLEELKK